MITRGSYKEITGPCPPPNSAGRYKISVKALDGNDIVVGTGSKERLFPEKKLYVNNFLKLFPFFHSLIFFTIRHFPLSY